MAKERSIYSCTECGATSPKWLGKCPGCGAWNTLVESVAESGVKPRYAPGRGLLPAEAVATLAEIDATDAERQPTGIEEFDRALGGGIVAGGVVLIGGDPGIGKSTLLLQALDSLARSMKVLYVTGEESGAQVALRSRRLGLGASPVRVLAEIQLEKILATLEVPGLYLRQRNGCGRADAPHAAALGSRFRQGAGGTAGGTSAEPLQRGGAALGAGVGGLRFRHQATSATGTRAVSLQSSS